MVDEQSDEGTFDLAAELGAMAGTSLQQLSVYVPNKDADGVSVEQASWVEAVATLLARIGGGVTVMPPVRGGWLNEERDEIVWEEPVVVYTYIKTDPFLALLPELRRLVHRMGRETRQGEVAVEFDGRFYRIVEFDPAGEEA